MIRATVRLRRGEGWRPTLRGLAMDGRRWLFRFECVMGPEDTSLYLGEIRWMIVDDDPKYDGGWLAGGDLADIEYLGKRRRR
jgi:hypothetical protein